MDTTEEVLNIANLLATLIPAAVGAYQKIQQNNQNAGLVPVETILADALSVGQAIEATADKELAALSPDLTPLSAPVA